MFATETDGKTTVLRLAHGKANALDLELLNGLAEQLDAFEASSQRALVLTGTGSIFCAGVDLYRLLDGGEDYLDGFLEALDSAFRRVYSIEKPIVGAINGHAIAGGCLLAAACDHRIGVDGRGKIGVTELFVGVPFPPLALEMLRAVVAPHAFEDLVLTGRLCGPAESARLGLVHEVCAEDAFMPRALEVARHLGSVLPHTYGLTKRQMRKPVLDRVAREFSEHDAAVRAQWRSEEVQATIREFLDATIGKGQE